MMFSEVMSSQKNISKIVSKILCDISQMVKNTFNKTSVLDFFSLCRVGGDIMHFKVIGKLMFLLENTLTTNNFGKIMM